MIRKTFLLLLVFSFDIYSQEKGLEKIMNLMINEIVIDDLQYFNLVDESLVEKTYVKGYESLSNMEKRELLKKDSLFPFELITNIDVERATVNWKSFNLPRARLNSEVICKNIVENNKQLLLAENRFEFDSLINQNILNAIVVRIKKHWSEKKKNKAIVEAYNRENLIGRKREDKIYYSFSVPIFSEDKKYVRITVYEYKIYSGHGQTIIYRLENDNLIEVFNFNHWRTKTSIAY